MSLIPIFFCVFFNINKKKYLPIQGLIFCVFTISANSVLAAGTIAGTTIINKATLSYDIHGIIEPIITSQPASFVVDNKINLTVIEANGTFTGVAASQTVAVTKFSVSNNGNSTQDYSLAVANLTSGAPNIFGLPDTFDATGCVARVESGATPGYQAAQDTDAFIDELAPDASKIVYVICSITNALITNDQANISLTASTATGGTVGTLGAPVLQTGSADTNGIDIVFSDTSTTPNASGTDQGQTARDATGVARSAYRVGYSLNIFKTAICSPAPADCSQASTGTIITYQLQVNLSGVGTAANLVITDQLPANLSYVPNSTTVQNVSKTDSADADNTDFAVTTPNTLTVKLGNQSAPDSFTINFRATIN